MADRPDQSFERQDFAWLVLMSLVFFVLVAIGLWLGYATAWRPWQRRFQQALAHAGRFEDARKFHPGIRQIWNPELGVVDRCVSCHLGYEWGGILPANLPQPLTPHPAFPFMAHHPFDRYGCTTCHAGQGWATTARGAHEGGHGWEEPMLSRQLAASCGVSEGVLIQMRCNFCHRRDQSTAGMDDINLAKKLIKKKKCLICHTVEGRGGHTAPDLTYEGDKDPDLFDFSHVTGPKTVFNWHVQHFIAAGKVSPKTAMPDYNLPPEQARALALLMISWRHINYPPQYIPQPQESPAPQPSATPAPKPAAPSAP
jgi:Cytochrome c